MSRRRAEDALAAALSSCRSQASPRGLRNAPGSRLITTAAGASRRRPLLHQARPAVGSDNGRRLVCSGLSSILHSRVKEGERTPRLDRDLKKKYEPDNMPDAPRVAVLGGGVTGLTTAYYLAQELPPNSKIVLYEGDDRWGGWIRSERTKVDVNGTKAEVLFERGPRTISLADGTGMREDRLVLYDIIMNNALPMAHPRPMIPRYLWHNESLVQAPPGLNLLEILQTPLYWKIGPVAMFNYFRNVVLSEGEGVPDEDMPVADWMYEVFGSRALVDDVASAMMHGIWGGDIYRLSAVSVLGWAFHLMRVGKTKPGTILVPPKEYRLVHDFCHTRKETFELWKTQRNKMLIFEKYGNEALTQGLAHSLSEAPNVEMRLGNAVRGVEYDASRDSIIVKDSKHRVEEYDKVISTLPAQQLSKITGDKIPTLTEFEAVSIMTVNIWYPQRPLVPYGIGYLIPQSCPRELNPEHALGVFFDSEAGIGGQSQGVAGTEYGFEPGTKLFVLMGGHYYDDVQPPTEGQAIDQAKTLLERQLGIPRDTPCFATAKLTKDALPQHYVGHSSAVEDVAEELVRNFHGRLAAIGGSFGRPGVLPAVRAGYDIASDVANLDFLSIGLEDDVESAVLEGTLMGMPDDDIFTESAMRRKRK